MSQSKPHKVQIRNRPGAEGKLSAGANMEVLLDGKRLGGATFVKFEVSTKKIAKVMIELYAEVEIDANLELGEKTLKEETNLTTSNGKPLARYTISSYSPVAIDIKKE